MTIASPLRIWHPFTQEHIDPAPLIITRAEGTYLYAEDGRRIIDAISSWWVNLHGHSHPHIARAIARQAEVLDHVPLTEVGVDPPVGRHRPQVDDANVASGRRVFLGGLNRHGSPAYRPAPES